MQTLPVSKALDGLMTVTLSRRLITRCHSRFVVEVNVTGSSFSRCRVLRMGKVIDPRNLNDCIKEASFDAIMHAYGANFVHKEEFSSICEGICQARANKRLCRERVCVAEEFAKGC